MKIHFYFLNIIILFSIISEISNEDPIVIEVIAMTGIINKNVNTEKTKFTFEIFCNVNTNITNNISKVNIEMKVKKHDDNTEFTSNCHIDPVRLTEEDDYVKTDLHCSITIEEAYKSILKSDINLIIVPDSINQEVDERYSFDFQEFDRISEAINVGELTIKHLEEDYCKNNNFIFEMTSNGINTRPLQSTICNVSLMDDEDHPIARCVIPTSGEKILCSVDVSKVKYNEKDTIKINSQNLIFCENGQSMEIPNSGLSLEIQEECGKSTSGQQNLFYNELLLFFILFVF